MHAAPENPNATPAPNPMPNPMRPVRHWAGALITAITIAMAVLAIAGGVADYTSALAAARVAAIVTVVFGIGCLVTGVRVSSGAARRTELVGLALLLTALVLTDSWLAFSPANLVGLVVPALLLVLTAALRPTTR